MDIKRGIDKAVAAIVGQLKANSEEVGDSSEKIKPSGCYFSQQ